MCNVPENVTTAPAAGANTTSVNDVFDASNGKLESA